MAWVHAHNKAHNYNVHASPHDTIMIPITAGPLTCLCALQAVWRWRRREVEGCGRGLQGGTALAVGTAVVVVVYDVLRVLLISSLPIGIHMPQLLPE